MATPILKIRDPWPPHAEQLAVELSGWRYGFALNEGSSSTIQISRDGASAGLIPLGAMATIERDDGLWPWVGYVDEDDNTLRGSEASVTLRDIHDALIRKAQEPIDWSPITASAGEIVQRIFRHAQGEAQPPLPFEIDAQGGTAIQDFEPRGITLDAFLREMVETGLEWSFVHEIGFPSGVRSRLRLRDHIGHDWRNQLVFQDGRHFTDARLRRSAKGHLSRAVAVVGGGTFRDRTKATYPASAGAQTRPQGQSPVLSGSRVLTNTRLRGAAAQMAQRAYEQSAVVAEQLSFEVSEGAFKDGELSMIEVGGIYGVEFNDLALGLGYKRDVRLLGFAMGDDGIIEMELQVLAARRGEVAANN